MVQEGLATYPATLAMQILTLVLTDMVDTMDLEITSTQPIISTATTDMISISRYMLITVEDTTMALEEVVQ